MLTCQRPSKCPDRQLAKATATARAGNPRAFVHSSQCACAPCSENLVAELTKFIVKLKESSNVLRMDNLFSKWARRAELREVIASRARK